MTGRAVHLRRTVSAGRSWLVRQLSLVAFLMAQQRPVTAEEIHEAVEGYGGMSEQAFLRRFYSDRSELEGVGLKLAVEIAPDVPAVVRGDQLRISQVLINYLNNAVKFTETDLSAVMFRRVPISFMVSSSK